MFFLFYVMFYLFSETSRRAIFYFVISLSVVILLLQIDTSKKSREFIMWFIHDSLTMYYVSVREQKKTDPILKSFTRREFICIRVFLRVFSIVFLCELREFFYTCFLSPFLPLSLSPSFVFNTHRMWMYRKDAREDIE